jgi:LmbE family N-acetylglucosaminyl deacetylase
MKKVLVVCAHPGDEILGCGGTLALHVQGGDDVRVLVLGDGWTSRVNSLEKGREAVDLTVLERQGREALAILGVRQVEYCRFPDNRFDTVPLLDLVKTIERVKDDYSPDIVYTNSALDLSVDQEKTCRAVAIAFRPQPQDRATALYSFEVPSSTEWNLSENPRTFAPNCFVNVEDTLDLKLKAFQRLSTEVRPCPHPRSLESIEHQASNRGASVGVGAAEAFIILRVIKDAKSL